MINENFSSRTVIEIFNVIDSERSVSKMIELFLSLTSEKKKEVMSYALINSTYQFTWSYMEKYYM